MATFVFPDAMGGSERFIQGLSLAQAARGHEVTVLTGDTGGLAAEERAAGVRILRYPLPRTRGLRFFRGVRDQVTSSLRGLAGEGFDIVHAHQIASAVPALDASLGSHRVLSFHASHRLEFEAERLNGAPAGAHGSLRWADRLKSMAIGTLDRRCLRKAERIVVHTRFVLCQVEDLVPSAGPRVRIIPAGLDLARFSPGDQAAARQRLGLPLGTHLIVTVRRLVRRMGIDLLFHAAQRLRSRGVEFLAVIGGAGAERSDLEALRDQLGLEHHVRFLGRVADEHLPELLRAADLIVVPSRSMEGFGMSTAEGLACGVPVVATNTGASPELLAPIAEALLVPPDADALADRLDSLLRDPARRRRLGEKAAASVRERFAWPAIVASLDEVYRELQGSQAYP